jgi:hypothetical protein
MAYAGKFLSDFPGICPPKLRKIWVLTISPRDLS